ncbi:MAG: PHP domain-containing protein [Treponema sp.]|nr:PHP domain-containing protein [Treponema sp.]
MAVLADLHNHSCLSPCGSLDMSPGMLALLAQRRRINVLALTDHNSGLNCPAFAKVCPPLGILPIFGIEASTLEELHVVCLFPGLEACMDFSKYAYSILVPFPNKPEVTGDQVYVDENENILGIVENYLVNPLDISVDDIGYKVKEYGGIAIPAHVDRPFFSMLSQLGAIVKGPWPAIECINIPPHNLIDAGKPETHGYPMITASDAHHCEHVGRRAFKLEAELDELAPNGLQGGVDLNALTAALDKRPK